LKLQLPISLATLRSLFIGVLLAFVVIEIGLRVIPNRWQGGTRTFVLDPEIGLLPTPSQPFTKSSDEFYIKKVYVNSFGFRDREREVKKTTFRVALLGDSFVEGIQVEDEEVTNRLLERTFPAIEFLNFGVSGFGTCHEYLTYLNKVRVLKPDLVLLFFCYNDVVNNSFTLETFARERGLAFNRTYAFKSEDGGLKFVPPQAPSSSRPLLWKLGNYSVCLRLIQEFEQKFNLYRQLETGLNPKNAQWAHRQIYFGAYQEPKDENWKEAWEITEKLILKLREAVEKDGAKLVLVAVADKCSADPNPSGLLNEYAGITSPDYNPDYVATRLETFSKVNGIKFLSLSPHFRKYRDEHQVPSPYFFFRNDQHWNPLGHRVAAEAVANYLVQEGLIPKGLMAETGPKSPQKVLK
jgi:lysophospholipase L1-like esterase